MAITGTPVLKVKVDKLSAPLLNYKPYYTNKMKTITKKQITEMTIVTNPANNLVNHQGQYKAKVAGRYFEVSQGGRLYYSATGLHFQEWLDAGLHIENKKQFIEAVYEIVNS